MNDRPPQEPQKPRIQYVRTRSGVNLGAWKAGSGPPLLIAPATGADIQSDWDMPEFYWYKRLSQNLMLMSYDLRGSGSSEVDVDDYSLEAQLGDLEAVVEWAGLRRFALLGVVQSGPVTIAYAAKHPDRVSHLVLFQTYADSAAYAAVPRMQAAHALLAKDWQAFIETAVLFDHGWIERSARDAIAGHLTGKLAQEKLLRQWAQQDKIDVTAFLAQVKAPTLVLQRRKTHYPPVALAKAMASGIPNAELLLFEGEKAAAWDVDGEEIVQTIERFVAEELARERQAVAPAPARVSGLTARERELLRLVAQGESNKDIAVTLSLSVHTVERHLANIYAKIGARGRADATVYALKNNLA